jgi:hypothetical protein
MSLRYPLKTIGEEDDYLMIQIVKYEAPGLTSQAGRSFALQTTADSLGKSKTIETIILPMPQNIQDNNAADWVSGTMNPLQASLTSGGASAVQSNNLLKGIFDAGTSYFDAIGSELSTGTSQSGVAGGFAAAAINQILGQTDLNQVISRSTGQVFNSNAEVLFNGVVLRPAFNFTFDMIPRSNKESIRIKQIIRAFKSNMLAKKNIEASKQGLFVSAPNVFKLSYKSGGSDHPFLHKFKPCALTQMNVNYNASGQYSTYSDATPVHMQLSLQFQELSPIYAEEQEAVPFNEGVGY